MMRHLDAPILTAILAIFAATGARAHISYTNRNFGSFSGGEAPVTISNVIIVNNFSWADATDADWGTSEWVRAYRFNLTYDARITLDVRATTNNGALLGDLLPGFSLFRGLAHRAPDKSDHDEAPISQAWLAAQAGTHEGNFNALGDWSVGNDDGLSFADLSSFTFVDYGVDGTAANFGTAPGLVGDGVADGRITKTFNLGPGDYTIFVGGADYAAQVPGVNANRGVTITLMVPEPSSCGLLLAALGAVLRRRK